MSDTAKNKGKKIIHLTPKGLEDLKEELKFLVEVKRQQISDNMGSAIADGDLRESAAYDEARLQQSENEARIADLEEIINRAIIVDPEKGDGARASLGATLELKDNKGETYSFRLVGTYEADFLTNKISEDSELGSALMGRKTGDEVTVKDYTYTINSISFE